jgi:aspartyl/asparaginyl-tRNA synthetase
MTVTGGFEWVCGIGPAFRAEPYQRSRECVCQALDEPRQAPSLTARHQTELTSIDMQVAWIDDYEGLVRLEEEWLQGVQSF